MKNKINVSEIFHSVQGEGNTMGKPSLFVRLQSCNLMCGGQGTEKDKQLHDGATWRCDTIETWLEGEGYDVDKLVDELFEKYAGKFLSGTQLIITGGEPMLQADQFHQLIISLRERLATKLRVEIETNGTIQPSKAMRVCVTQFNVSPKLANSGMPKKRRVKPEALQTLANLAWADKAIFKFVVTRESDISEILNTYKIPFEIPNKAVWLMPGCSNLEQFGQTAPKVAELCKHYGFKFSSRLQINLWNKTVGV